MAIAKARSISPARPISPSSLRLMSVIGGDGLAEPPGKPQLRRRHRLGPRVERRLQRFSRNAIPGREVEMDLDALAAIV